MIKKIIPFLIGFSFLFIIMYGLYKTISFLFDKFNNLKPEVSVAIVAGCCTILVSVLSIIISKNFERKQQIRQDQHAKKVAIYESFIELWFNVLFADKLGTTPLDTDGDFIKKFMPILNQMIPWASDDVIKAFVDFRDCAVKDTGDKEKDGKNSVAISQKFELLLINIRKDLGHSCNKIKEGDLTKIFINDYDDFVRKNSK